MASSAFRQASSFKLIESASPHFDALCFNKTQHGPTYADAIQKHAADLIQSSGDFLSGRHILLVDIPRGGLPTGDGAADALRNGFNKAASLRHHHSHTKSNPDAMFQQDAFDNTDVVIIADGIIGTGTTIINHMAQIPDTWNGSVVVLANAAALMGAHAIQTAANDLCRPATMITGRLFGEDECEWVDFPGGKHVYLVGTNTATQIDFALPDFGDAVQPAPRLAP